MPLSGNAYVYMTSLLPLYELIFPKIFEFDVKPQTNKQTNRQTEYQIYFCDKSNAVCYFNHYLVPGIWNSMSCVIYVCMGFCFSFFLTAKVNYP